MNEVRPTFSRTTFIMIRRRRSAATNKLSRDVPTILVSGNASTTFPTRTAKSISRSRSSSDVMINLLLPLSWAKSNNDPLIANPICNFHFAILNSQLLINVSRPSNCHRFRSQLSAAHPARRHFPFRASESSRHARHRPPHIRLTIRREPASTVWH